MNNDIDVAGIKTSSIQNILVVSLVVNILNFANFTFYAKSCFWNVNYGTMVNIPILMSRTIFIGIRAQVILVIPLTAWSQIVSGFFFHIKISRSTHYWCGTMTKNSHIN